MSNVAATTWSIYIVIAAHLFERIAAMGGNVDLLDLKIWNESLSRFNGGIMLEYEPTNVAGCLRN